MEPRCWALGSGKGRGVRCRGPYSYRRTTGQVSMLSKTASEPTIAGHWLSTPLASGRSGLQSQVGGPAGPLSLPGFPCRTAIQQPPGPCWHWPQGDQGHHAPGAGGLLDPVPPPLWGSQQGPGALCSRCRSALSAPLHFFCYCTAVSLLAPARRLSLGSGLFQV